MPILTETALLEAGDTPNNPRLPVIVHRAAIEVVGARDPAALFEKLFAANGWGGSWRNGVFGFRHYHPSGHEVLGIAVGEVEVELGGSAGRRFALAAGDVAVLPAGTGHKKLSSSRDLLVVGAYPAGSDSGHARPGDLDARTAAFRVVQTALPEKDPVFGPDGPLVRLWRS